MGSALGLGGPLLAQEDLLTPPEGVSLAVVPDSLDRAQLQRRGIPFGPGERLEFSVDYGIIHAGTATLEVHPMKEYKGRECYHFVSQAKSARMFDSIYKVRDRIDTLVDSEEFMTWQYRKVQREGKYRADHKIIYDHESNTARYADGQEMEFPEGALDAVSAFYLARVQDLEVGREFVIPHHSDKKTYFLKVVVHRKEKVKVPAGEYECFVIEPLVKDSGPFKNKGRMTIWITDDVRRLPVLMKSEIGVGAVSASLSKIHYGKPIIVADAAD